MAGLFANVTVQIPFSDGQAVTIVFHSPSGDAKKIGPDDEIIAYRWLLNKRDITHVVSPEGEGEVTLESVGKRIAQLVEKNSARFQATQKDVKAQNDQLVALKTDTESLSKENMELMNGLKDQQDAAASAQAKIDRTSALVEKQKEINADLENQLAALNAKAKADEAARAVAVETAAKQAAIDGEFEALKDEALSLGMDPQTFDMMKQDGMISDLKGIMAKQKQQSESDKQAEEYNRIRKVGETAVSGIRVQDMETAGKMWEMLQKGELAQSDWDKYVEDLYSSDKAPRPETGPDAKTVLADVLSIFEANGFKHDVASGDFPTIWMDHPDGTRASATADTIKGRYQIVLTNFHLLGKDGRVFRAESLDYMTSIADRAIAAYLKAVALNPEVVPPVEPTPADLPIEITKMASDQTYKDWVRAGIKAGKKENGWDVFDDRDRSGGYVLMTTYDMVTRFATEEKARAWASSHKANQKGYFKGDEVVPPVEPTPPAPEVSSEPPAVAVLNDLLSGKADSDTVAFGNMLDDAAGQLEAAGLMDQYDSVVSG